jgi:uncharacterized membrane protein YcfT
MQDEVHRESLEEEATHATDEARMVLPGVQAILGFQLIAVFNQRFQELGEGKQILHLVAFILLAAAMGLIMAPAAYHRQAERGCVTRRFVTLASSLLSIALGPLLLAVAIDAYLLTWLVVRREFPSICVAGVVVGLLAGLWFVLPQAAKRAQRTQSAAAAGHGPAVLASPDRQGQHATTSVD